ncbi:recombinase family protein (plasmid) [Pseudorhodobacter turbinis]|uniref:Recombinase family protein n=1 Tax=Pseudorhodobacter turbinis TaxID=2500533 RepID=A0A4P8ELA8_9RHOB|nr:recombinase family protein [Pseudorhodobacter turbinis]QCO57846.1 recombinase family protein [Pseudorhodobacter turbinis]
MTQPLRAVIYARFSTDMQRDASIDDQIRSCREHAKRQGLNVIEVYSDKAISGASLMRSGIQKLLRDAQGNVFDVVSSEALDRLSRNQADIAAIFQKLQFRGIMIETVSEAMISEMHIGLKGTMNSLFIKDLAIKTHRGLKGRALAGKSAGGKAFGYQNVIHYDASGEPIRGDRKIDPIEADVVRRIFTDYAAGLSPRKIAEKLNEGGITGPTGRGWGTSTLHGNRERGTGILNNELYIGRQIWNRLAYVKDPDTGKRVSRLNPEADWVITDVPDLRIIDDALWDAVRARQGAMKVKNSDVPIWDRRRPRTLFSGLMACGCCGGGFSKVNKNSFGCSIARNKGKAYCTNMAMISQVELEELVLKALQDNLMDEDALKVFCEEYAKERNRLQATASQNRSALEKELAKTKADHAKLVDAIIAGVPAEQVKDKMIALDARRIELEAQMERDPAPSPIRLHPKLAETYRDKVATLIRQLQEPDGMLEAKGALRGLIDRIVLQPTKPDGKLAIHLEGALAQLLILSLGSKGNQGPRSKSQAIDNIDELVLVAGRPQPPQST